MPFAILLESPPPQAKEQEPKFIRTKTMAKAGYPRLKAEVDRAIKDTLKEKCIIWKCNSKSEYPQLSVTDDDIGIYKKITFTHRAVAQYVLKRRLSYDEKCQEVVDHHCGEKKCINPYHLFVMSPGENNEKKHWLRMSDTDRLIISAWLTNLNLNDSTQEKNQHRHSAIKYSTQEKNQHRHSAIKFLEFIKDGLNTQDILMNLHSKSNDGINNLMQEYKSFLLRKVEEKSLKDSTVNSRVSYVKKLLKFVEKRDLFEILQKEKDSEVKQLNVVEQAAEESSKKRAALKPPSIKDEDELQSRGLLALESGKRSMVNTYDEIFGAALSLPPGLRVMLAEHLLKSLDSAKQEEIDAIWAEEAEKRVQAIEQGQVTLIPGEQVFRELRSRGK